MSASRDARAVVLFLAIAFLLTTGWIALVAATGWQLGIWTALPASAAPALGGLVAAAYREGSAGPRRMLAALVRVRFAWWLWPVALLGPILLAGASAAVQPDAWVQLSPALAVLAQAPLTILLSLFVGGIVLGELGWRGFLLDLLADRLPAWLAIVLTAVAEALWQLPNLLLSDFAGRYLGVGAWAVPLYAASILSMSALLSWLYLRSKSLLLTSLSAAIMASAPAIWLFVFVFVPVGETAIAAMAFGIPAVIAVASLGYQRTHGSPPVRER